MKFIVPYKITSEGSFIVEADNESDAIDKATAWYEDNGVSGNEEVVGMDIYETVHEARDDREIQDEIAVCSGTDITDYPFEEKSDGKIDN